MKEEIMNLVALGYENYDIAIKFGVSEDFVEAVIKEWSQ